MYGEFANSTEFSKDALPFISPFPCNSNKEKFCWNELKVGYKCLFSKKSALLFLRAENLAFRRESVFANIKQLMAFLTQSKLFPQVTRLLSVTLPNEKPLPDENWLKRGKVWLEIVQAKLAGKSDKPQVFHSSS